MRREGPFDAVDLADLDGRLFARADAVVAMREVWAGMRSPGVIGLRHDMDNTLDPCVELAEWQADRGYRATYFVLHDSPYWGDPDLPMVLDRIASLGHEIGIHCNALAVALETGGDPDEILDDALAHLRGLGHDVIGVAPHGDPLCRAAGFVNDEMFAECARPEMGDPRRKVYGPAATVRLQPRPLADFGLSYETYRLPRSLYLSDSGARWNEPVESVAARLPLGEGQLHVLLHPCWWTDAFPACVEVTPSWLSRR